MLPKIDYEALKKELEKCQVHSSVSLAILSLTKEIDDKRWILKALVDSCPDSVCDLIEV